MAKLRDGEGGQKFSSKDATQIRLAEIESGDRRFLRFIDLVEKCLPGLFWLFIALLLYLGLMTVQRIDASWAKVISDLIGLKYGACGVAGGAVILVVVGLKMREKGNAERMASGEDHQRKMEQLLDPNRTSSNLPRDATNPPKRPGGRQ